MSEINRVELRDLRERTIERLSEVFAQDLLDLDEFEDRIDQAHRATAPAQLEALVGDVGGQGGLSEVESGAGAPVHALALSRERASETGTMVAILGGAERKGSWRVPARLRSVAVLGGADIDLREAVFSPGVHEIEVVAVLGGVDIVVPPNVAVECSGSGIMGAFESINRAPADPDPDRPLVRIRGWAVMGGVTVSTRFPGESERQARRRVKRQLKAARKAGRRRLPGPR